jgi:hypothetical protein
MKTISKKQMVAMRKTDLIKTYTTDQLHEAKQQLMHTYTKANEAVNRSAMNTQAIDWMTDAALAINKVNIELSNRA